MGLVLKSVPDDQLDDEVEALAVRAWQRYQ